MRAALRVTWRHTAPQAEVEYDDYGRPIEPAPTSEEILAIGFDPGTTSEPRSGTSRRVNTKPTLYFHRHHPITAGDTITVHGLDYEVEGDPGVWQSPVTGRIAGVEVTLRRVVG